MTQAQEVVYIDANVFAYRLLKDPNYDNFLNLSTSFFDDIDTGKYRGVTSTYTKIEYIGILKKVISYIRQSYITPIEEQIALDDFQQFVDGLEISLTDADALACDGLNSTLFHLTSETLRSTKPYFHKKATERRQWMNMGGADALQINLAMRSGANRFATFDRGFKGLNNPSIIPLIIQEEYASASRTHPTI